MAERKSGPVKPPVIDLTARATIPNAAKDDATKDDATQNEATQNEATKTTSNTKGRSDRIQSAATSGASSGIASKPAPGGGAEGPAEPDLPAAGMPNWVPLSTATAGGAIIGVGLTYLLASFVALPSPLVPLVDPAPRLAAQDKMLNALEARLSQNEKNATRTQVSLDATITQLDTGLNELRTSIGAVKAAIPAPQQVDLSGVEDEIKALRARLDAMAAGASTADAAAISQNIAGLSDELAQLVSGLADTNEHVRQAETALTTLDKAAAALKAALAAHIDSALPSETGPALKLPLIISGLDAAFAAGRPFEAELAGLKAILPELEIAPQLAARAGTGLLRPDELSTRFEAALPDMLGAGPAGSNGDWVADAIDWAKALLALRPATEMAGNSPDALVSRLEGALSRRDYAAAAGLMAQLPPPMRLPAGTLSDELDARAAADALLVTLSRRALAPAAGPAT